MRILLILLFLAAPASAQAMCTERSEMLKALGHKYQEAPVAMGLAANGSVLEVLAEETGKTWTIIVTHPNGISCALAAGSSWEGVERLKGEGT